MPGCLRIEVYNYTCEHGPKINAVCGTFFGYSCPTSYHCVTDPMVADDQGICCPNKGTITVFLCKLSLVMRKPAFCICENKDADQLRGSREADQRLCFR